MRISKNPKTKPLVIPAILLTGFINIFLHMLLFSSNTFLYPYLNPDETSIIKDFMPHSSLFDTSYTCGAFIDFLINVENV